MQPNGLSYCRVHQYVGLLGFIRSVSNDLKTSDISKHTPTPTSRHGEGTTANLSLRTDSSVNVEYRKTMISRHPNGLLSWGNQIFLYQL